MLAMKYTYTKRYPQNDPDDCHLDDSSWVYETFGPSFNPFYCPQGRWDISQARKIDRSWVITYTFIYQEDLVQFVLARGV